MKRILAYIAILACGFSYGQSKRELIELGDQAYENGNFASAVYFYSKTVEGSKGGKFDVTFPYEVNTWTNPNKVKNSDSTQTENFSPSEKRQHYAIDKLADSYRKLRDYDNAVLWYSRAVTTPSEDFKYARYWYGSALMKMGDYDNAQKQFELFKTELADEADPFHELATDKEISCEYALNPVNTKQDVVINKMDSIFNSGTSSMAVSYYESELSVVFTSARSNSFVDNPKEQDPMYSADLFQTQNIGNGWEPAERMPEPITSSMHEGAGALSVDRTTFYFTRWDEDDKNNCHIYVCKKFNGQWMIPLKLNTVNKEGYRSMCPALNLDETKLFFVSDMPGGQGGLDIWYCPINSYGELGDPVNLGPTVNTAEDENTPFHHFQTNTLFFSSEGHIGFGGYDVFRTKHDEDANTWSTPVNMGAPINSSKDDTYFILDKSQKYGFMTSDREKCADCDTLIPVKGYCNKIYRIERPELQFSINGFVFDGETGDVIPNALITFKDIKGQWAPFFVMTDDEGYYEKELEANMDIFMKAQKTKYFGDAATVSTTGLTESTVLMQDFELNRIPATAIEIEGIEYDFDKATLRPRSKEILDELVEFLEVNDNLTIEIQSHTDARGNDAYNKDLSRRRAQSVVDYLVDKGISRDRLEPNGYGESEPAIVLDDNKKPVKDADGEYMRYTEQYINTLPSEEKREEAHQRNRRTAFKVLSEDNKVLHESANQ